MEKLPKSFRERVRRAAKDPSVEARLRMGVQMFGVLRKFRIDELGNFEELRQRYNEIKEAVFSDHEGFIARLREQVESRGGRFHLAENAEQACRIICGLARDAGVKIAVKSKSMTSEEVGLSPALEGGGIEVWETDLGEFIIQLAKEPPYHIVGPALHKTRGEIAKLFAENLGVEPNDNPQELTRQAREFLREKFLTADMGITGANALVAENGALILIENEGNIRLTTTLPRIHIALAGIDKIIPTMSDLAVFLKLLPRSATGQKMSGYVSMLRGPGKKDECDGAEEFHLVLLDNGRSRMRDDPVLRGTLKCVRCGACLFACPIYQHIGGHAYGSVYTGPIGAMITRALTGVREGPSGHPDSYRGSGRAPDDLWLLPFASSLCGQCTEVCPAKIPIHRVLLDLRQRSAESAGARSSRAERAAFRAWSELWKRPAGYKLSTKAAAAVGKLVAREDMIRSLPPPGNAWTEERDFPSPAPNSFHERWRSRTPTTAVGSEGPAWKGQITQADAEQPGSPARQTGQGKGPRPGDPDKFVNGLEFSQGIVSVARGVAEVRDKLKEILSDFTGQVMVRWTHPDLELLGLDELAAQVGITVASPEQDGDDLVKKAAAATVGVTAGDYCLAESGTIVLLSGPGRERCISLLPPAHIAVVRKERVLADIDDLVPALSQEGQSDFHGITLISGPSMTGDIEMTPVLGVHGPNRLFVILWSKD
ncbi:MAG: LUD domain-containing protein [Deltaproteobacteria bacterium]|nr:MAG: LUD domain-containing protein [Deltaproteobacteria bacterium]